MRARRIARSRSPAAATARSSACAARCLGAYVRTNGLIQPRTLAQHAARCQPWRQRIQAPRQRDVQAIGQEGIPLIMAGEKWEKWADSDIVGMLTHCDSWRSFIISNHSIEP